MPITDIKSDADSLTLTIIGEYPVPVERLWQAWSDPRQIERFWGPPTWPATFTRHDMAVGGRAEYFMTGPDGERSAGYWEFVDVEPGRSFTVVDGFAGDDGAPNDKMPSMTMRIEFEQTASGSKFVSTTTFGSLDSMQQLVEMGMLEGVEASLGQMGDVLEDLAAFAHDKPVDAQLIGAESLRVSRIIRGSVDQVWRAHHDPALLQRWLLGPPGWVMTNCEVGSDVGDTFLYEWESEGGEHHLGLTGEILESVPPRREVTTESMVGIDSPPSRNEMTLTPLGSATLLSILITYPSAEVRSAVLESGMTDGMEASYARLEDQLSATV